VIGEREGRFSRFVPGQGVVRVDPLYDRDRNNFGPRLSVVGDASGTGKTILRAGWGLYYDAFSQDFFAACPST